MVITGGQKTSCETLIRVQTSLFSLKSKYEAEVQRSHTRPFLEGFVQTSGDI